MCRLENMFELSRCRCKDYTSSQDIGLGLCISVVVLTKSVTEVLTVTEVDRWVDKIRYP